MLLLVGLFLVGGWVLFVVVVCCFFFGGVVCLFKDGRKHVGMFKENKRHGEGVHYDKHGNVEKRGRWDMGDFVG